MRIVHVVTLITPDGAFGGPVRVAVNQAAALRERGHDVEIIGGTSGFGPSPPTTLGTVPVRLFAAHRVIPRAGFSGLVAPGLARWARRHLAEADVLHIHSARDLITLPVARLALSRGKPYVLQPHGMINASAKTLSRPLDALLTRRVLRGAATVFYLTPQERIGLEHVARGGLAGLSSLRNGVPPTNITRSPKQPPEVLFMARLQERKRPLAFVELAAQLLAEGVDATFSLVGPDEGQGHRVAEGIARASEKRLAWEGALAPGETLARLAQASLYVLPSVDEPYPMSVLEALSVGCPVVVTDSCGLAPAVAELQCGLVVGEHPSALADAVRTLLAEPARLQAMSRAAHRAAVERFGSDPVTDSLEEAYRSAVDSRPAGNV